MTKTYIATAGISGFIMILLGALGSHLLTGNINPEQMNAFRIANQYQIIHTLAILALVYLQRNITRTQSRLIYTLFVVGIVFFSFSIYLTSTMSFTHLNVGFLRGLAPVGGTFFMLGWLVIFWSGITYINPKKSRSHSTTK
ncbi:MAG: DUF423 domain-containing protein [Bacteroidales bacterium]|nr:DUF423 domain-containing protein [Bacteroidales bacterium]